MRLHRFYVSQPLGEEVVISDVSIIKQWIKVFKYKNGDFVILFNGKGEDVVYSIKNISTKSCALLLNKKNISYIPKKNTTLYLSLIKKNNFELVVQKATEIGITTIIPILSDRSEKKNINFERLKKIAIEASEQCGRGDIPKILPITPLSNVLKTPLNSDVSYVLQMDGVSQEENEVRGKIKTAKNVSLFVGPEGGWSENEEKLFKEEKIEAISLGKTTLRAETASIVGCALMVQ